MNKQSRKHLSAAALLSLIMHNFKSIPNQITGTRKNPITLADCLMSALAMFGIKSKSLLAFNDAYKKVPAIINNLRTLYYVNNVPSDTHMRQRLDLVDSGNLRESLKDIFAELQRGKALEQFQFIDGYYLLSVDTTEYFLSNKVHCDQGLPPKLVNFMLT